MQKKYIYILGPNFVPIVHFSPLCSSSTQPVIHTTVFGKKGGSVEWDESGVDHECVKQCEWGLRASQRLSGNTCLLWKSSSKMLR